VKAKIEHAIGFLMGTEVVRLAAWQTEHRRVISGELNFRIQQQIPDAGIFGSVCVSGVMIGTIRPT
jgi:hypothetical protein